MFGPNDLRPTVFGCQATDSNTGRMKVIFCTVANFGISQMSMLRGLYMYVDLGKERDRSLSGTDPQSIITILLGDELISKQFFKQSR